ncbi:hypothetical protein HK102_011226, partial [Quaeritorhiza haematococci]
MDAPLQPEFARYLEGVLGDLFHSSERLAVRSSGADEDSSSHSFAGQFESFMFVPATMEGVGDAIKKCWLSCYAPRVMLHRLECGLPIEGVRMAVVVQRMVDSICAGVGFSRHPLKPISADVVLVEGVWGQGEGLVSGAVEPDTFEIERSGDRRVTSKTVVEKKKAMRRDVGGEGLVLADIEDETLMTAPCLTPVQCAEISSLLSALESKLGTPQDFEWAYDSTGRLYCLQVRPIVTLPVSAFFEKGASPQGGVPVLWDNSNIVESYSGVTSPLTFSYASSSYGKAYRMSLEIMDVERGIVEENADALENMLGLVRGRIYYNLMNWYRLLVLLPLGDLNDPKFMETMMGVKQGIEPTREVRAAFAEILAT